MISTMCGPLAERCSWASGVGGGPRNSVGLEADRVGWLPLAGLRPHNGTARVGAWKPSTRAVPAKIVSTVFKKTVDRRNSEV